MNDAEPKKLGRYLLHRLLGEGGMGRVYEAELCGPAGFRKKVALKVLKEGGEQLVREAKLGGLLRHPNLVEVYELGWAKWETAEGDGEGTWFCAMELVTGGSVGALMPLSPQAVVDVGVQVCAGLSHAHNQVGLVHLDLKPANLLLERGVVKVADLGISMARGFKQDARIRGTPGYMAPEQRGGGPIDARADVYAIGILLLTLSVGHRTQTPERVPWLEAVARRCLETDPNARFANTQALQRALLDLSVSGPGLAERVGAMPAARSWQPTQDTFAMTGVVRSNLEPEPDAFVGRIDELGQLQKRLGKGGVITLKGLGGTGKTRLAKRALLRFTEAHPAGQAWFCDLSAATGVGDVVAAVASVLSVKLDGLDEAGRIHKVGHALSSRRDVALVLDNFEQVVAHSSVLSTWWSLAPKVRFLVTSRERLGIVGEQLVELEPLPDADAVRLLVARAQARGRDVAGDRALTELARRLDGLPLALELAAARFGVLSPAQVVQRLDQRFKLLVGGPKGVPRQSTLQAALAWSWDLLDPWQQRALFQLTVFRGGFSLESAEAVLELSEFPDAPWALDAVSSLLDRSLVVVAGTTQHPRFRLFETVRVFAATRGIDDQLETRFCDHFSQLGQAESLADTEGDAGAATRAALALELENLRQAATLAHGLGQHGSAALSALAATAILEKRGPASQGLALLDGLDQASLAPALRERVHLAQAGCAMVAGDHALVCALVQPIADGGQPASRVRAWRLLGEAQVRACDNEAAMAALCQALELSGGSVSDQVRSLRAMGNLLLRKGDLDAAFVRYKEAISLLRRHPDGHARGLLLVNLGVLASHRGQANAALAHYRDAVRALKPSGDAMVLGVALSNLGALLSNQGKLEESLVYLERALRLHRDAGARGREVVALLMVGPVYWAAGDLVQGHACAQRALELAQDQNDPIHLGNAHRILAAFHRQEGTYTLAHQHLQRALDAYQTAGLATWQRIWDVAMGQLLLAEDQAESALSHFQAAGEGLQPNSLGWIEALGGGAECHAKMGDLSRARADFDQALELSEAYPELTAELCVGRARVARQLDEDAEAWLARAEAFATQLGWQAESPMRTQIDTLR